MRLNRRTQKAVTALDAPKHITVSDGRRAVGISIEDGVASLIYERTFMARGPGKNPITWIASALEHGRIVCARPAVHYTSEDQIRAAARLETLFRIAETALVEIVALCQVADEQDVTEVTE